MMGGVTPAIVLDPEAFSTRSLDREQFDPELLPVAMRTRLLESPS